jgi:hypothetical protein
MSLWFGAEPNRRRLFFDFSLQRARERPDMTDPEAS